MLTEEARASLARVGGTGPPQAHAAGGLVLPAWTNRAPDWRGEVLPGVWLSGDLALTNTAMGGAARVDSARARFTYRHRAWSLPSLAVAQGRTALNLSGEENDVTRDFHCFVNGQFDLDNLRFLVPTNAMGRFNLLTFRQPAALALDVTGNLRDLSTLSVTGRVAAGDFAIREQRVDRVTATLCYTQSDRGVLSIRNWRAPAARNSFAAEKVTLDLAGAEDYFCTMAAGHVSPVAVGAGHWTQNRRRPWRLTSSSRVPNATVDGCIPLKQAGGELVTDDADLWFDVVGTAPFRWRRFETPHITGTIHWLAHDLILTNVVSRMLRRHGAWLGRF